MEATNRAVEMCVEVVPARKRRMTQADRSSTKSRIILSELLRHSLAKSGMLERPTGYNAPCPWCNHSHRGPCLAANLAPRPKSLFVCSSSSLSAASSEEWLRGNAGSRRASIDTSELGDGQYASNIRDLAPDVDLAAGGKRVSLDQSQLEQAQVVAAMDKNIDGGYAWIILVVVFLINSALYGSQRSYGLIFDQLAREGGQTRTEAAYPFSIMGTIEAMAGPVCGCLLALTGSWRLTTLIGSLLVTLGHLLAAFWGHSQLGHTLSMGFISGFGLSFMSISFFQVNKAYFDRYRCIAAGIGQSGAAFGTLIISAIARNLLDHNKGTHMCYLALSAFMAPNILLALFLRPLGRSEPKNQVVSPTSGAEVRSIATSESSLESMGSPSPPVVAELDQRPPPPRQQVLDQCKVQIVSGAAELDKSCQLHEDDLQSNSSSSSSAWSWIKPVVTNPYFHLIWPTQLLFQWFNFTLGMIMFDFGKDRGMSAQNIDNLVPAWAFGTLFGRIVLSCLVDFRYISTKTFTIVCFCAISAITLALNRTHTEVGITCPQFYRDIVILALIFLISTFIALLNILINNLVVNYVEPTLQPISMGLASFTGSFFLYPRANAIGHYRDTFGNYDTLLVMLTWVSLLAGLVWLIVPPVVGRYLENPKWSTNRERESDLEIATQDSVDKLPSGKCVQFHSHSFVSKPKTTTQ